MVGLVWRLVVAFLRQSFVAVVLPLLTGFLLAFGVYARSTEDVLFRSFASYSLIAILFAAFNGPFLDLASRARRGGGVRVATYSVLMKEDVAVLYPSLGYGRVVEARIYANTLVNMVMAYGFVGGFAYVLSGNPLTLLSSLVVSALALLSSQELVVLTGLAACKSPMASYLLLTAILGSEVLSFTGFAVNNQILQRVLPPLNLYHAVLLDPTALCSVTLLALASHIALKRLASLEPPVKPLDVLGVRVEREVVEGVRVSSIEDVVAIVLGRSVYLPALLTVLSPAVMNAFTLIAWCLGAIDAHAAREIALTMAAMAPIYLAVFASELVINWKASALGMGAWLFRASGYSLEVVGEALAKRLFSTLLVVSLPVALAYAILGLTISPHFTLYALALAVTPPLAALAFKPFAVCAVSISYAAYLRSVKTPEVVPSETLVERRLWEEVAGRKVTLLSAGYVILWALIVLPSLFYTVLTLSALLGYPVLQKPDPMLTLYSALTVVIGSAIAWALLKLLQRLVTELLNV